jgi:hypothetical protein
MMAWEDFSSVLHRAGQAVLGEDVTFSPNDSLASVYPSTTIRGNFNEFHKDVEIDDNIAVELQHPMLTIWLADLPYVPKEGYTVVIRGSNYFIAEVRRDEEGAANMVLRSEL